MLYDIYFHNDFDGRASAAVVLAFLRDRGDDIEHFVPVKYDIIPEWIDDHFLTKHKLFRGKHNLAIIVDFPYHPQAAFWLDHHIRPFRKEGWGKKFKTSPGRHYDDRYASACHLAYDSLQRDFGWKPAAHFKELVKWLDIVDGANYRSAKQTVQMKEPALQINMFVEEHSNDLKKTIATIHWLSETSLDAFVKKPMVKKSVVVLRRNMEKAIQVYQKKLEIFGRVMMIDLSGFKYGGLGHYVPYYLHPRLLYSIRFHPFLGKPNLFHVNVSVNPWWRKENKKNMGKLLQRYGGGGHETVGGVEIEGKEKLMRSLDEIIVFLNKK